MALREILAKFDLQVGGLNQLAGAHGAIGGLVGKLQGVATVLAGSALVAGLSNFVKDIVKTGDEIATTADRLGLSTSALQEWRYMATAADVTNEELSNAFKFLTKNMYDASQGSGEAVKSFKALGIDVKGTDGTLRSSEAVMGDVLTALGNMSNETERSALALKIFGKGGLALNPLLKMTEDQVKALKDEFIKLGGGMSDAAVIAAGEADQSFNRFDFAMLGLKGRIALDILPAVTRFVSGLSEVIAQVSKATANTNIFKSGLIAAGVAAAGFLISLLAPIAPAIAGFLLLWLVIDDIITTIEGGDSVIQGLIDSLFGIGSTHDAIWRVKDVLHKIGEGDYAGAVNSLADGLEHLGANIMGLNKDLAVAGDTVTDTSGRINIASNDVEGWNEAIRDSRSPIQAFGDWIVNDVIGSFEAFGWAVGQAISWIGDLASTIGGFVADTASTIWGWASDVVSAVYHGGGGIYHTVDKWLGDTAQAIYDAIADFFDAAFDLGASIVDGIIDGLSDGVEALTTTMSDVVNKALETAKEDLDSDSPSKVFAALGRTIPQGLAKGISDDGSLVSMAAGNVVNRSISTARAVTMNQTNQITVNGAGNPYLAARLMGNASRQAASSAFDDAYQALIPEVA